MLAEFVSANRAAIIASAQARVAVRTSPKPSAAERCNGIPVFLDQLCDALRLAEVSDEVDHEALGKSAGRHGGDLLRMGLTVAQVVHDYGDVCQAITNLAVEQEAPIPPNEFKILNLCLDDAIAEAATEFARQREGALLAHGTERLGILAHELRNHLNTGMLSFEMIKTGQVAPGGSTARMVDRSFLGLRNLIDRSLAEVRLDAGVEHLELISVAAFVEEVEIGAFIQAKARDLTFTISSAADPTVTIEGDWQILAGAVANLLQNALKFTRPKGHVSLTTHVTADRVLFEVEDECGGLPPGKAEELFRPYEQRGSDRTGVGLGLSICMRAAKSSRGDLRVRDLPGKGCVFTLDLPRKAPPPLSLVTRESQTVDSSIATGGAPMPAKPTGTPKAVAQ
jgi:signal transduction histidine kinase